ncbi:uncharacterized protein UBRO_20920 [Ustilago bromivora]|uniref:Uncharacterized protein n=1 Tax=Ustilago bromivora TaxID=307758 RepID=A0A1K0HE98_9BASI|nr:uncharacterized protein UBRO_20920 [Ustilago bromivora]
MLPPTTQLASSLPTPSLPTPQGPTLALPASLTNLQPRLLVLTNPPSLLPPKPLEDTIHLNFTTILTHIDSLQSSPHPPSTPTSLAAVTSQPPLPETPAQAGLVFTDGQVRITEESSEQRSLSFAKAIPNICALAQVWLIYTAICVCHTWDLNFNHAILAYLEILIKFQIYLWKGVAEYHLAICCQHFGMGVTHKWAHTDTTLQGQTLLTNFQTLAAPSSSAPSSKPGAKSSHPSHTTTNPPPVEILSPTTTGSGPVVTLLPASSSPGSSLADTMLPAFSPPGSSLVDMLLPAPSSSGSGLPGGSEALCHPSQHFPALPSTSHAPLASSAMLVPSLDFFVPQGITNISSDSASALLVSLLTCPVPPAHPNTACELPIFDCSNTPATVGSLKLKHWAPFLGLYPEQDFANQLRGALRHGALLGYSGPLHHTTRLEGSNLPMDPDDKLHLHQEIEAQALSIAVAALGFHLSCKKTVWSTTHLEILGIKLDSVAQTASITNQRRQRIPQLCQRIIVWDCASLLELQQVADASKHSIGGHCGHMEHPTAVFSQELSQRHCQKDIRFLEALAVLEALQLFSSAWSGVPSSLLTPSVQWQSGITTPPSSFVAATKLSKQVAFLLWNGLTPTTHLHSTKICSDFATFISTTSHSPQPFPTTVLALIKSVAHYQEHAKTYHAVLRSWHVDLSLSTSAFSSDCLARAIQGFKHSAGNQPQPPSCPSCSPSSADLSTPCLPSATPDTTGACFVQLSAWPLCASSTPACGIPPEAYSGHSFWRGATTWAAANGTNSNMIQGLGRWRSDCFRHYVNTLAAEHAATLASGLYYNANQPLDLSQTAWHNF